jgi:hypothetical protein
MQVRARRTRLRRRPDRDRSRPGTVRDTLTDIPGWAGWMPAVRRSQPPNRSRSAPASARKGACHHAQRVLQVDPPRALARTWKVSALRTEAIEHWALEQRDGVTFARTEQSWRGPLPRLLPCPMRSMLAQEQANSHKLPIAAKHSSHSSTRSSPRRPRAEPSSRHSPGPGSSSKTPRSARLATS